ncbi:uncharacterized protein LOC105430105 [Pogonomyrmex barbatus]|uniref:Uncharacterized protein LOC105430105 n=1 Tax=Pogonomyrmex barbatus TaxID=144034 RepID=A0A6I9WGC8_9HYME|nr:uncharacterized protein LOC105430105 [Pogonomyrmex barbatus]
MPDPIRGTDSTTYAESLCASSLDLYLLNEPEVPTCIRLQGSSVVDLTLCSSAMNSSVGSWRIRNDYDMVYTDHVLIDYGIDIPSVQRVNKRFLFITWSTKQMDKDRFAAAMIAGFWAHPHEEDLGTSIRRVTFVVRPRLRSCDSNTKFYADDLPAPERARQDQFGSRCSGKGLQKALKQAIAKDQAWKDMLESLEGDPWGLPYKIVNKKLRGYSSPVCESLEPDFIRNTETSEVTLAELRLVVARFRRNEKAPGPLDGIKYRTLTGTFEYCADLVCSIFTGLLRTGVFPAEWKHARLVLLRKPNKPLDLYLYSSYRPLCLFNTFGKIYEKIVANRLTLFIERPIHIIDAIHRTKVVRKAFAADHCVVAVSLDISNAFNSVPWTEILRALGEFEVSDYLYSALSDYLRDCRISYVNRDGELEEIEVNCGFHRGRFWGHSSGT